MYEYTAYKKSDYTKSREKTNQCKTGGSALRMPVIQMLKHLDADGVEIMFEKGSAASPGFIEKHITGTVADKTVMTPDSILKGLESSHLQLEMVGVTPVDATYGWYKQVNVFDICKDFAGHYNSGAATCTINHMENNKPGYFVPAIVSEAAKKNKTEFNEGLAEEQAARDKSLVTMIERKVAAERSPKKKRKAVDITALIYGSLDENQRAEKKRLHEPVAEVLKEIVQ